MKLTLINLFILIVTLGIFISCTETKKEHWSYPTLKPSPVSETFFGKEVKDPYRNLEDLNNVEVVSWLDKQNNLFEKVFKNIAGRDSLRKEIVSLYSTNIWADVPRTSGNIVYVKRYNYKEGTQEIVSYDALKKETTEIFSNLKFNRNSNINVDHFEASPDGNLLAIGLSSNGNERSGIYIWDVARGKILADSIVGAVNRNPQWLSDGSGFFYANFKKLLTKEDSLTQYEDSKIKFHKLGTSVDTDREIFSRALNTNLPIIKTDYIDLYTFGNEDKVLVAAYRGDDAALYAATIPDILSKNAKTLTWKIVSSVEEKVKAFGLAHNEVYVLKNPDNSYGTIEQRTLDNPLKSKVIYSGRENNLFLEEMIQTNNALYIKGLRDGLHHLIRIDIVSKSNAEIALPFLGSISLKSAFEAPLMYLNSEDLYFSLSTWNKEESIYKYDNSKRKVIKTSIKPEGSSSNVDKIEVKEVNVLSYDNTSVPLTLIYNKDIKLNGTNPTILEAYGAYAISMNPYFDAGKLAWINRGGVYAIAHVRGGGEKGEAWHYAAYKSTKANSWKDFIACAEYLINNNYCTSQTLGAEGASAGGITIGRAITDRPDLFKAAYIGAGLLNAFRIEQTFNTGITVELGTTKDSVECKALYDMDVLHHIKDDTKYPNTLFIVGKNDARLPIWQTSKVVAKMQAITKGEHLVLIKITDEGHFGGMDDIADKYTFFLWQLGNINFKYLKSGKTLKVKKD